MRTQSDATETRLAYIFKILAGLLALGLLVFCAFWLPLWNVSSAQHHVAIAVLLVLAVALTPAVYWIVLRRDELQRLQHLQASASTIAVLASGSAVVGILQASQWLPLFNQFWALGLLLAVWGVQLMRADHRFH